MDRRLANRRWPHPRLRPPPLWPHHNPDLLPRPRQPASPHINWEQQLFAFGLGIYYSAVYYRTGSLLNPILAHNFGDGLVVTAAYLVYLHLH